jgi:RNA polymerase sigma-B factor
VHELTPLVWRAVDELTQQHARSPSPADVAASLGLRVDDVLEVMAGAERRSPRSLDSPLAGYDQPIGETIGEDDVGYAKVLDHTALAAAIALLNDRDRHLLSLYFEEGLTQREIADRLGVSQMQISRLLNRLVRRLRDRLPAG